MDDYEPLYSRPSPPDAWGDGCMRTGLLDPAGRPIFRKNAIGFTGRDHYVIFPVDPDDD